MVDCVVAGRVFAFGDGIVQVVVFRSVGNGGVEVLGRVGGNEVACHVDLYFGFSQVLVVGLGW